MTVQLRQLQRKDCIGMLEWMHDIEVARYFRDDMLDKTEKDVLEFIDRADIVPLHGKSVHYAIVEEADEYLGTISLKSIDLRDKNAEYAISLRKTAQGRAVAYLATRELLNIAFHEFDLERVYLNVISENKRAIRLYEKCGFIYEGELRDHLFIKGNYISWKLYGMIEDEYSESIFSEMTQGNKKG